MRTDPRLGTVDIDGRQLTVARWGDRPATTVLLHDGLGSIAQWRDVPARIAARTGAGVVAYDRAGHGASTPVPDGPWPGDWLDREARVLDRLLDVLGIEEPVVVGHSDGGTIALLHAVAAAGDRRRCAGVIAVAAHSFVEPLAVASINAMRAAPGSVVFGLARHHAAPDELFAAWSGIWTDPAFRDWDIREALALIGCPVLVVQGDADEFATDAQLTTTVAAIGARAVALRLAGVDHGVHRSAPDRFVEIVARFHDDLGASPASSATPSAQ